MVDVDQLLNKASDAFEIVTALQNDLAWAVSESEGNYTLSRMPTNTGFDSMKIEYYVEGNPRVIGRKFFENYPEYTAQCAGATTDKCDIVQRFSDDTFTTIIRLKGIAVVSPREFNVFAAWLDLSETSFAIIFTSVEIPERANSEDAVVGILEYDYHLFEALGGDMNQTHYINIAKIDPKGSIPSVIANTQIDGHGQEVKKMIDLASR